MTHPTCTGCPSPARWRDTDGRQFCGSHVPANGKPMVRIPGPPVDLVDVLDDMAWLWRDGAHGEAIAAAAAEIRRLRAALDKSVTC